MKSPRLFLITLVIITILHSCSTEPYLVNTVVLSELSNAHEIISDDDHLIISDGIEGTTLFIYSLSDLSLYSKFGGTGDTTGKFIVSGGHEVGMEIQNDTLLISSHWKASFFTKEGELIKELPIKYDTYGYRFLGGIFQGMDDTTVNDSMYYIFSLYDEYFKFQKEITRIAGSNQGENGLQLLVRKYQGLTYDDKFYFKGKSNDFEIEIYNASGVKEGVIAHDCERMPVTEEHINSIYKGYQEHPLFGQFFEAIKDRFVFPDYLPAIYKMDIANDFIYALTYESDGVNTVMYKMDLNGKLISKLNVPIQWIGLADTYPYTISNNHLYQLVKSDVEMWELHIIEL